MELIWRRTSIVRNWLLQPMFLVMVWSLISTNTFFLVPFGSLLDSNSSEYTNRWGNCHLSKENFTLWTYKFNTVLRSFYVLLGNRRKNKTMIKVNSRKISHVFWDIFDVFWDIFDVLVPFIGRNGVIFWCNHWKFGRKLGQQSRRANKTALMSIVCAANTASFRLVLRKLLPKSSPSINISDAR